ncbi:MAG: aspartate aminotransferase family protein [Paraburkholderia sp.]|nr:aspartate aminotransferase family protein [Paraburkholderia sp.]
MPDRQGVNRECARRILARERDAFVAAHPQSQALSARAAQHLLFGVPLHWMNDWPTPFSLYVEAARGAAITDVDGLRYADFCLGDTGAMFGHAPPAVARALARQAERGFTTMLPGADAVAVSAALAQRFGLPYWQFAMTASDANRFALRWARAATGRGKIVVFNGCYHGTVDDVFVDLAAGRPTQRASLLGQVHDLLPHTRVVEFNDLDALARALADDEVACVLAEPVMTNVGMVLPEPGFWREAQALMQRHGTLLLIDETHTISSSPRGYAREHGIEPDLFVLGKPVGGGVPCAAYGFRAGLAERLAQGLAATIARHALPWCVTRVGARSEFQFCATPPRNGSEARAAMDDALERVIHLYLLNRGVLITPFHNMMLVCPDTTEADVERLLGAFDACLGELRA